MECGVWKCTACFSTIGQLLEYYFLGCRQLQMHRERRRRRRQ